jgi:hypothetical protein
VDVVTPVKLNGSQFNYSAENNKTGMRVMAGETVVTSIDFRDFKYLSNLIKF